LINRNFIYLIVQAYQPIAELKPIKTTNKQQRPFGLSAREFSVPDGFDAPLPEEIINALNDRLKLSAAIAYLK